MPGSVGDAVRFQASLDLQEAGSFQTPVDAADDFSLRGVNDQIAFRILGVA